MSRSISPRTNFSWPLRCICSLWIAASVPSSLLSQSNEPAKGEPVKGEPAKVDASVAQIEWQQLEKAKQLPAFASIEKDEKHGPVLKILRSKDIPQLMELATIEQPKIKEKAYACRPSI